MKDDLERLERKIDTIVELLTGNTTPERGVILRLDRLEQTEKRRTWWVRATATAWIGSIVTFVAVKCGFKI